MATGTIAITPGTITTRDVTTTQADILTRDQVRHLHAKDTGFNFVVGDTPTTKEVLIHKARAAGFVRTFYGLLNVDGSSTSVTYDLKKNGSSVLTGVVTVTSSTGDRTSVAGTISGTGAYSAGDVFTIALAVSSSTGASGPLAGADFDEYAA
jgi:hypothetical protein